MLHYTPRGLPPRLESSLQEDVNLWGVEASKRPMNFSIKREPSCMHEWPSMRKVKHSLNMKAESELFER